MCVYIVTDRSTHRAYQLIQLVLMNIHTYVNGSHVHVYLWQVGALTALTDLRLSHNDLESLVAEVGGLVSMTVLHLTHNRLMSMPPEIGYWTSLTELSVASNRLTALPIELGLLTILSRLDIAHNEISVPPAEVRDLCDSRLRIVTCTCLYFATLILCE